MQTTDSIEEKSDELKELGRKLRKTYNAPGKSSDRWISCPVCNKNFHAVTSEWAWATYRGKVKIYLCSYGCMRKAKEALQSTSKFTHSRSHLMWD